MYDYLVIIRKATWSILLPELLAFDSLCSIVIHAICSYYMSKLGAILGRYSSTPLMASVFSDRRVLQGFFYPREVRLYTQLLLCLSIGTLFWSLAVIVKALEHEYFYTRSEKYDTISPKLPFSTPFRSSTPSRYTPFIASSSATDQSSPIRRTIYISRIKKFSVLFCFCIAFFKNQKITSTLIYHPVSSPILSSLETTPEEQSENGEVLSDNMHTSSMHHLKEIVSPVRHNDAIVPSIVHFVFGMEESFGDKPFGFAHYLSMYSGKSNQGISILRYFRYSSVIEANTAK